MKSKQNILAAVLVVLLLAAGYGLYETSRIRPAASTAASALPSPADSAPSVDESSLTAAQQIVRLPTTPEEALLAREALRLADKEMDMAFADAVRQASFRRPDTSAQVRAVTARLQAAEQSVARVEARIAQLTAALATAKPTAKDSLGDRLAISTARLELAHDEVDDAHQDLIRVGGDPQGRMQAMIQAHKDASTRSDSTRVVVTVPVETSGLIHRAQAWLSLDGKKSLIAHAKAAAETSATKFATQHDSLEAQAAHADTATRGSSALGHDSSLALVRTTRRRAAQQKARAALDQRADNERELARVYGTWVGVLNGQKRTVVNHALRGVLAVLIIGLIGLFFDKWLERLVGRLRMERRRLETLRTTIRVSLQVTGVLIVLLVIFGVPNNFGTFLGLAGAGLTVALKDFIIGFFGWFMLMGRNGIRIGDLVEINGVTGEVVELGLFHTVLLETGDWTDSNHPTGRRVTFTNSFAIEGHYFNFSTSGQWLWDEIRVVVPAGRDPYPIVDAIRKEVEEATADSARLAEQEWKGASRSPGAGGVAVAPAVNIKPIVGGTEMTVRYITRAPDRLELRSKIYHTAIELLGERRLPAPVTAT
jgi:small-conductance mechanosensitive channel